MINATYRKNRNLLFYLALFPTWAPLNGQLPLTMDALLPIFAFFGGDEVRSVVLFSFGLSLAILSYIVARC